MTSSADGGALPIAALNCSVLATRLRCDSEAPFDSPVVPPVYCRNNRSSPFKVTGSKASLAPSARTSANASAPAQARIHRRARKFCRAAVAGPGRNDRLQLRGGNDLRHRRRASGEHDHDLDAGVLELVLEFARRIQRIDIDLRGAGPDDAEEGDRESQQIGHHHRDAVALFHAELLLQIGREIPRLPVHIGIAQGLAEGAECGPVRMRRHGRLEQLHNRPIRVRVDIGWDAVLRVGR